MDIQREIQIKPWWHQYWYLIPITLLVVATILIKRSYGQVSLYRGQQRHSNS